MILSGDSCGRLFDDRGPFQVGLGRCVAVPGRQVGGRDR
jgi:hypothetical protein